jgi:signal transduction histidine kinase
LLGVSIFILKDFDLVPYNTLTVYSLQIGSAIEAILLSFALADKINISKKEKWEIQELHRAELLNNQILIKQQTMQFIGREIHDSTCQKLTLAAIYAQQMDFTNLYPAIAGQLKGISKIINDSLVELQDLSRSLAVSKLEHNSLSELLQLECERINATSICKARLEADNKPVAMNVMVRSFLLRTIQEFIQNSLKHSNCNQIYVKLNNDARGLYITVSDDGKGFDTHAMDSSGIGLNNMKRRIQVIGGTFNLKSQPGNGSILNLFIPLELLNQSIV